MRVQELIEELQKCNPQADVLINADTSGENESTEVDKGNPASSVHPVIIYGE